MERKVGKKKRLLNFFHFTIEKELKLVFYILYEKKLIIGNSSYENMFIHKNLEFGMSKMQKGKRKQMSVLYDKNVNYNQHQLSDDMST